MPLWVIGFHLFMIEQSDFVFWVHFSSKCACCLEQNELVVTFIGVCAQHWKVKSYYVFGCMGLCLLTDI